MREEVLYTNHSLYRDTFRMMGYYFGSGRKSVCIVGNLRGNEYQQIYTCSLLVKALKEAEERGNIMPGHEILVIPSGNPYSMNIGKRFWPIDNTDINRMFPGYVEGETTQRIAGAIFDVIEDYDYGIQFASYYLPGKFMPNVTIMKSDMVDDEYIGLARNFGMPYVVLRNMRPYDTTTLNYNWQVWETKGFSLYTTDTDMIDVFSAARGVKGVFSFLASIGILKYSGTPGYLSQVIEDAAMISVRTETAGLFVPQTQVEAEVKKGQILAAVLNPVNGDELEVLTAPCSGVVFFLHAGPMVYGHTAVIKLIPE